MLLNVHTQYPAGDRCGLFLILKKSALHSNAAIIEAFKAAPLERI
jgi:hypothetical protein